MSPSTSPKRFAKSGHRFPDMVTTTIFISNLHCPSCIDSIREALDLLQPPPQFVSHSIVSHSVVIRHSPSLSVQDISDALEVAGFDIHSIFQTDEFTSPGPVEVRTRDQYSAEWVNSLEQAVKRWLPSREQATEDSEMAKRQKHVEKCEQCQAEAGGVRIESKSEDRILVHTTETMSPSSEKDIEVDTETLKPSFPTVDNFVIIDQPTTPVLYKAVLAISGMTCSSCVGSITHAVQQLPWVRSIDVNLLTNSGTAIFDGKHRVQEIVSTIEDTGFDATVDSVVELQHPALRGPPIHQLDRWIATYAIGGMTCSSCVGNVTHALDQYAWIEKVEVNLITNSATIVFHGKEHMPTIQEAIEDAGYDATLDNVVSEESQKEEVLERSVSILVAGMYCPHCPSKVMNALGERYGVKLELVSPDLSQKTPILNIKYVPDPPGLTIRHILQTITDIDSEFKPTIYHPPTIEQRASEMHARERQRILYRLAWSFLVGIPTFIIGIVYMDLVPKSDPTREWFMMTAWAGNVSRTEWSLLILSSLVYFWGADLFHRRALKQLWLLWRRGSRTPFFQRFYRFGSMDTLLFLGTSLAYWSSVAELIRAARRQSSGTNNLYFDTVVFLTFFILIGRFIEAYSKAKTGDAVSALKKLRPVEAILVDPNSGDVKTDTDVLEIGDVVRIPHGASPPFDGVILDGTAIFDESSLTGESRPINKAPGDTVYSGTINKGGPIKTKITTVSGTSMLDQIINVVREGQTRRAPTERFADRITSIFVPTITLVAIVDWVLWLILCYSGVIPNDWRENDTEPWSLWALRFAIAVFVVACPCGIGLAAPTALFVGGGIAAKYGILVKGGGEAFEEASKLDCIVFDKTGTLTQGGDPAVTDFEIVDGHDQEAVLGLVKTLEESSSHPIARALVSFSTARTDRQPEVIDLDEIPGRGLKGTFKLTSETSAAPISAIIGNETFMSDYKVEIPSITSSTLKTWQSQGKSVALMAIGTPTRRGSVATTSSVYSSSASTEHPLSPSPLNWTLAAIFSISDPLRPEAAVTISELKKMGIDVWMLSGDNITTAKAVGSMVGIPESNIIAGVMPDQKAEKISYLQRSLTKKGWKKGETGKRAKVAMVGDGINDSPALAAADVSIAMGAGSDIAISSASFILINSKLTTILILLQLSKKVFRRVKLNFGWALVYNICAMPIAAGAIYAVRTGESHDNGGGHARLDPVWASLAMAMSSISVVSSSLALRTRIPGLGFRVRKVKVKQEE